jgi:hypothetical protein
MTKFCLYILLLRLELNFYFILFIIFLGFLPYFFDLIISIWLLGKRSRKKRILLVCVANSCWDSNQEVVLFIL